MSNKLSVTSNRNFLLERLETGGVKVKEEVFDVQEGTKAIREEGGRDAPECQVNCEL